MEIISYRLSPLWIPWNRAAVYPQEIASARVVYRKVGQNCFHDKSFHRPCLTGHLIQIHALVCWMQSRATMTAACHRYRISCRRLRRFETVIAVSGKPRHSVPDCRRVGLQLCDANPSYPPMRAKSGKTAVPRSPRSQSEVLQCTSQIRVLWQSSRSRFLRLATLHKSAVCAL